MEPPENGLAKHNPNTPRRAFLTVLCLALGPLAGAQTTSNQFWPELDAFCSFNTRLRLKVVASRSTDGQNPESIAVGTTLNMFARRLVRPRLVTPNETKAHLLTFGIGYLFLGGANQASENRIQLEVQAQAPLPWRLQAGIRNRFEIRFIQGSGESWRYRFCPSVQRTFKIRGFSSSPYAQVEFYYNSAPGSWNKTTYQGGVDVPLGKRFDVQVYFERDDNRTSTPRYVNAVGVTSSIYF